MKLYHVFKIFYSLFIVTVYADLPCIPKAYNESIVCVCNSTYCDTVTRAVPKPGHYVQYTSSKAGKRFSKIQNVIGSIDLSYDNDYNNTIDLLLDLKLETLHQTIEGFGGAATDSAGINWKSLPPTAQQYLINSYFSKEGIEYNMIRVPAGSTDFSTRFYAYNEYPINDTALTNFTFVPEDITYKIPLIHECMKAATAEVKVFTASWAPPRWMTLKDYPSGNIYLNTEYYQTYADYLCRFAELYNEQGIKIWGLSAANEPLTPTLGMLQRESMSWTVPQMAEFLYGYLGPTVRNCSVQGIKILANDDQRLALPLWFSSLVQYVPEIKKYIDGVAVHYYTDTITPAAVIARAMKDVPDMFIIGTEACEGSFPNESLKVDLGSWKRAKAYILDILEDLNYNFVGWVDWNMCLNPQGGPNWIENFVDSPIIVDAEKQEFYKQPMYYAFGHFSKFIPRGSKRIEVVKRIPASTLKLQEIEALGQEYFDHVAFWTPRGTVVVIIHNDGPSISAVINIKNQRISTKLDNESITTIEFPYNDSK